MAYALRPVSGVDSHILDAQVFEQIIAHGPDAEISDSDLDVLLEDCTRSKAAKLLNAAGWLAAEKAFYYASVKSESNADLALGAAGFYMNAAVELCELPGYVPDEVDEVHRCRLSLATLPIYASLARNLPITRQDLSVLQYRTADYARAVLLDSQDSRVIDNNEASGQYDGLIGELLFEMGFNRAPIEGSRGSGIVGLTIASTFRQNYSPFSSAEKTRNLDKQELTKRNWDVSLILRTAKPGTELAGQIGRFGQAAILSSGLHLDASSLWRYAGKFQIKSKVNALVNDVAARADRRPRQFTRTGNGTRDIVSLPVREDMMQSVASRFDQSKVIVFGLADELGLSSPKARFDVIQLLVAEATGENLAKNEQNQLTRLSQRLKASMHTKIAA